jgi:hypothetical protein
MMVSYDDIVEKVKSLLVELGDLSAAEISEDTALIGPGATIKSRVIVEILLALEEYAEDDLDTEFDWTSDSAISIERSVFRAVGPLAKHLHEIQGAG